MAGFAVVIGSGTALTPGAPKTTTVLDVVVLLLFFLQVLIFVLRWLSGRAKVPEDAV